jgi:hypothetical protein
VHEAYNNQTEGHLTALLTLGRLRDDTTAYDATLYGGVGANVVKLAWIPNAWRP